MVGDTRELYVLLEAFLEEIVVFFGLQTDSITYLKDRDVLRAVWAASLAVYWF